VLTSHARAVRAGGHDALAARHRRRTHDRLQIALSATGLAALGVPADVIDMMAPEATDSMASRGRVLTDPDPATWQLGGASDRHHRARARGRARRRRCDGKSMTLVRASSRSSFMLAAARRRG
jgi:hypothetical protein